MSTSVSEKGSSSIFGKNDSVDNKPIESTTFDRLAPRQVGIGTMRGSQDIVNTDGSIIRLGVLNDDGDFGIGFFDADGTLVFKLTGPTIYMYDSTTGVNNLQLGILPDGTTNLAIAKSGQSVEDAF